MESEDPRWPPEEAAQGKMHTVVPEGEEKVAAREILPMMIRRRSLFKTSRLSVDSTLPVVK